jgi:predicted solute-binding protein
VDTARGEMVEKELNAMIERRSRQKDPEEDHQFWQESVRRYSARRDEENRLAWHQYHRDQAERHRRTLNNLIEHHQTQAAKLMQDQPKGDTA